MNMPGGGEWIIILIIVVLLFGAKKLPDLGGSVGKSIKEFRKGVSDGKADSDNESESKPASTEQ